jgi:hypothetical protein
MKGTKVHINMCTREDKCANPSGARGGTKLQTLEVTRGNEVQTNEVREGGQWCRPWRCMRGDRGADPGGA